MDTDPPNFARTTEDERRTDKRTKGNSGAAIPARDHSTESRDDSTRKEPSRARSASQPPETPNPTLLRPTVGLPRRAHGEDMSSPLARYDPTDFEGLPTAEDENPHRNSRTQLEDIALAQPVVRDSYTDAPFPRPFVPAYKFLGNVQASQAKALEESPYPVLALVVHGGGQRYIKVSGEKATKEITKFLSETLVFSEDGDRKPVIEVHAPEVVRMNPQNRFGQPFTFFVVCQENTDRLRAFLKWQGVFALNPTLSFTVYDLKNEQQPWTIMTLTGLPGAVINTADAKRQVLAAIKADLWNNRDFCFYVATEAAASTLWKVSGDVAARVKAVSDTLDIEYIDVEDSNSGSIVPAYLIYGKPLSNDYAVYKGWLKFFVGLKGEPKFYRRGLYRLNANKIVADCKLCKDSTHCKRDCPLPTVTGWRGPTPSDLQKEEQAERESAQPATAPSVQTEEIWRSTPKTPRGRGGGRGRGNGRGGPTTRGKNGPQSSHRGNGRR
ncbi:hypothetical protein LXA43DRAFT_739005 [Ganoderma leucocontextum]|nr:hypothetical protein LXA43DRAFT_739005 [Ganoderma leucocontextum]